MARGAVRRLERVVATFFGLCAAWGLVGMGVVPRLTGGEIDPITFIAGFALLTVGLIAYVNLPGSIDVGSDGVFIDWRDEKKYLPYAEVASVGVRRWRKGGKRMIGLSLALDSGDFVDVPYGEDQFGASKRVEALLAEVEGALEAYRDRAHHADGSLLSRGDRTTGQWVERLRRLGEGANAGPREAAIRDEDLWSVVEDATVPAEARAGAAAALRRRIDDSGKARLRAVASATAAPRLRIAIERAADEDEAALEQALQEVAEDEAALAARKRERTR